MREKYKKCHQISQGFEIYITLPSLSSPPPFKYQNAKYDFKINFFLTIMYDVQINCMRVSVVISFQNSSDYADCRLVI